MIIGYLQKLKGDPIAVLKAEKDELESSLSKEKLNTLQLKQELAEAETRNSDLSKVTTLIVPLSFWKQFNWGIMLSAQNAWVYCYLMILLK